MAFMRFPSNNADKQKATVTFHLITSEGSPIETTGVTLYLPKTIEVSDGIRYNAIALGIIGNEAFNAAAQARGTTGLGQAAGDALANAAGSVSDVITGFDSESVESTAVLTKVLQAAGFYNSGAGAGIRAGLGRTAHPHQRNIFEAVNLRQFSFEFDMVPADAEDALRIKEIVKFFRTKLYPEVDPSGLTYIHPDKFLIQYRYAVDGQGNRPIAHKIKPCFLTAVKTTFNPTGAQAHHADGEFVSTRITLSFSEERALERKDIEDGF